MNLLEWAQIYVKHRFMSEVTISENAVSVTKKGQTTNFIVIDDCNKIVVPTNVTDTTWIVVPNSKDTIDAILVVWESLVQQNIRVLFADPNTNHSWGVIPATHSKIVASENLEKSLLSLFNQL